MSLFSLKRRVVRLEQLAERRLTRTVHVVIGKGEERDAQAIKAAEAEAGPYGTIVMIETNVPPRDVELEDEDEWDDFDYD